MCIFHAVLLHFAAAGYVKFAATEGGDTLTRGRRSQRHYYMDLLAIWDNFVLILSLI